MKKNLIFDVDGTLWNSTEIVAIAWNAAIEKTGFSKKKVDAALLQREFGKPMDEIADDILTDVPEREKKNLILEKCCHYEHRELEDSREDITYDGVKEGLKALAEAYRLYVVSNCQCGYIELFLRKTETEAFIRDTECFGNTLACKGESIRILMERNGLLPEETVYIGDTAGDETAARQAGISFLYAAYGFGRVEAPDGVVQSFGEIGAAVKRL